jgi:hypothetical protein
VPQVIPVVACDDLHCDAEHLLGEVQAEVTRITRDFGGKLPAVLGNVLRTWLDVAKDLAANLERERARGFEVLAVLQRMPDNIHASVVIWNRLHQHSLGIEVQPHAM